MTYLVDGQVLHRDSLGSEQVIRPGQVNLMTAGNGVVHAEEPTGHYRGGLHGVQLWVAQPSHTRHGAAAFEHHADLPRLEFDDAVATVVIGAIDDFASPARRDTDHVGIDLDLCPGRATIPLRSDYEHALVVFSGACLVDDVVVQPGHLAYLGVSRDEIAFTVRERTRAFLVGGVPFEEPVLMWWNFVARTREEITTAYGDWAVGATRFGHVDSQLPRSDVDPPPWTRG